MCFAASTDIFHKAYPIFSAYVNSVQGPAGNRMRRHGRLFLNHEQSEDTAIAVMERESIASCQHLLVSFVENSARAYVPE